MAKKQFLFAEAERLYVSEQMTLVEIAARLSVSERALRNWKSVGGWDTKRTQFLTDRQSLHQELYEFTRLLMRNIKEDFEGKQQVDAGRLYTLTRLLSHIQKVKDYEDDVVSTDTEQKPEREGLSEEALQKIEELMGLR